MFNVTEVKYLDDMGCGFIEVYGLSLGEMDNEASDSSKSGFERPVSWRRIG